MPKKAIKPKSQKQLQLGEQIKRILADIFLYDDNLKIKDTYITINRADVSPNSQNAKIFVNIFGNPHTVQIVKELNKVLPYLRSKLAKNINLRVMPEITFILDDLSKDTSKVQEIITEESTKFII